LNTNTTPSTNSLSVIVGGVTYRIPLF
jgi:hypothetical protein